SSKHRRILFHGLGERWIEVRSSDAGAKQTPAIKLFRFQFKGFYPALEAASRLTPGLRGRLEQFVSEIDCSACHGSRLREESAACQFRGRTIGDLVSMPLDRLEPEVRSWKLDRREKKIAGELLREISSRLRFLLDVGLHYLTLHRGAATLSGGEAQRIRLAAQLGSGLCGVLYVLDEPTIGLHPRDNLRLISALHRLRDLGNTLLVVEHDRDVIAGCDHLCDFGPQAGKHGGRIVAKGQPRSVEPFAQSVTAGYLDGSKAIEVPPSRRPVRGASGNPMTERLRLLGASEHNLQNVDLEIPLGVFTAITGPSGSGKSTLIEGTLYPILAKRLHRSSIKPGRHDKLEGLRHIDKVIRVDQSPIGNAPSSNPATYTGVFDLIRQVFASLPESVEARYQPRAFSFNVAGGRCETCEGSGQRRIEMHFLPDVWVPCEECGGRRYGEDVLQIKYHGKSIADVLEMPIGDATELFSSEPRILRILQTLCDVGLDYITLGQSAPTLSGGEAQRVKLASELARPGTGSTLYLLDEPTTGLHFDDIAKLLDVIQRLVELGNTCVVIEHNLDVIKCADWVIDMGPGAGIDGGRIVFSGTPEELADAASRSVTESLTAPFVAEALGRPVAKRTAKQKKTTKPKASSNASAGKRNGKSGSGPKSSKTDSGRKVDRNSVWKTLGRKWHSMPKGFEDGASPEWPINLPDRLFDQIEKIAGDDCLKMAASDRVDVVAESGSVCFSIKTRDLDAVRIVAKTTVNREEADALDQAKIRVDAGKNETTLAITRLGQATKPALKRFFKRTLADESDGA
ncbi:MAG: excinuclease ABC subunit UvrA, partial [Planctomycetota bacterium]